MIRRKFISESLIYTVTGALPLASGLVLLPFYTNWLTADQFGGLALYIPFTLFMQVIFNFAFDNYIGISYIDNKNNPRVQSEIIGTIVVSMILIGMVVTGFSLLLGAPLFNLYNIHGTGKTLITFFPYGFMAIATAFFNSMFKTYTSLLIYQQRPWKYMFMNIVNFVLTISISLTWLTLNKYSLDGPMWGRLLSGAGIFLLAIAFFYKEFRISFSGRYVRLFIKFCTFFVIYQLLSWILSNIDRFVIGNMLSLTEVAIFDFAFKCLVVIEFLQNGLSSAIIPNVFSSWASADGEGSSSDVRRYFNGFSASSIVFIPVYCLVIPLLVPLIVTRAVYYESFRFLPILGLGYIFICLRQIYSFPLLAKKRSDLLTRAFAYSAAFQILLTIAGIHYLGLWGAVWASLLTKPFQVFFMYMQSRKIMKLHLSVKKQVILPLLITVPVLCSYLVFKADNYYLILITWSVISLILTFVYYRNELPEFFLSMLRAYLKKRAPSDTCQE